MSLSVLNNFELCYRGTSFKVQGGSVIAAFFLAHNYVSKQFGNYVEYGTHLSVLARYSFEGKITIVYLKHITHIVDLKLTIQTHRAT